MSLLTSHSHSDFCSSMQGRGVRLQSLRLVHFSLFLCEGAGRKKPSIKRTDLFDAPERPSRIETSDHGVNIKFTAKYKNNDVDVLKGTRAIESSLSAWYATPNTSTMSPIMLSASSHGPQQHHQLLSVVLPDLTLGSPQLTLPPIAIPEISQGH